jgi:hypothetical protein
VLTKAIIIFSYEVYFWYIITPQIIQKKRVQLNVFTKFCEPLLFVVYKPNSKPNLTPPDRVEGKKGIIKNSSWKIGIMWFSWLHQQRITLSNLWEDGQTRENTNGVYGQCRRPFNFECIQQGVKDDYCVRQILCNLPKHKWWTSYCFYKVAVIRSCTQEHALSVREYYCTYKLV